jgi:hypothetical protein
MTSHFEQRGVAEIRDDLVALRGRHVYLKVEGDTDPTPYQGFVFEVGEATVVIVDVTESEPARSDTRLREAEPAVPAMRQRSRIRIDHIVSVTEETIAREEDMPGSLHVDLGAGGVDEDAEHEHAGA